MSFILMDTEAFSELTEGEFSTHNPLSCSADVTRWYTDLQFLTLLLRQPAFNCINLKFVK